MHILLIQTIHASIFRTLLDALKEIVTETNISFDKDGLKIKTMDTSHTVLVHLKLDASKFEKYECKRPITIGVNMIHFFKLTRSITTTDLLTLYVDEENMNILGIQIENSVKKSVKNIRLHLLSLNNKNFSVPPKEFDFVVNMPSSVFQKICRDMNTITEVIDIKATDKCVYFRGKGDFADQEFTIAETKDGLHFIKGGRSHGIVQGVFLLKHLLTFTRCTNLSESIDIYLANDYPIIICYKVGILGEVRLCLSPKLMNPKVQNR